MMQELVLRIKIDRDFDSFNEFEGFLMGRVRELMLERIEGYLEELDSQVGSSFKGDHPEYPEVSGWQGEEEVAVLLWRGMDPS